MSVDLAQNTLSFIEAVDIDSRTIPETYLMRFQRHPLLLCEQADEDRLHPALHVGIRFVPCRSSRFHFAPRLIVIRKMMW